MKPGERRDFLETQLGAFLNSAKENGYITIEVVGKPDEYVQYQLPPGRGIYGEVSARQWLDPERPLSAAAVASLSRLGFTGGGPERNHSRGALPGTASELVDLTEQLFAAAYSVDDEFGVLVHVNLNDVALPRAVPFTRDLIVEQLENRGLRYLRDADGDCCVDIDCPGSDEPVTFWFVAEGIEDAVYRISATSRHRPVPATRHEALERCNSWNYMNRWPTATVADNGDDWRVLVHGQFDLRPGVTVPLFANFTDDVVMAALQFWEWIAAPATAEQPAANDEAA
jgi:Putative bacterial sensory transduction regulator